MPEGHTIHRAAQDHHKRLSGQTLQVSSPQGKFSAGSEVLSGKLCHSVEALGKHLLYRFESRDVLHVHLGLFGRIRSGRLPLKEPIGAVRVRLVGDTHCIDINGPAICEVIGLSRPKFYSIASVQIFYGRMRNRSGHLRGLQKASCPSGSC